MRFFSLCIALLAITATAEVVYDSHGQCGWVIGEWSGCSVSCGDGTKTRTLSCIYANGGAAPNSVCHNEVGYTPITSMHCNMGACQPPPTGGQVQGDPQFVGLSGQSYQIHGIANSIYNIITDDNLQVNAKFVFLTHGKCPTAVKTACWTHPGTYLGEIGIKAATDKLILNSGDATTGFQGVTLNNQVLRVGEQYRFADGFVSFNSTHTVTVEAGRFRITFDNSDHFVNQQIQVSDWNNLKAHGLLGQTHSNKVYPNAIKYIEGSVADYQVTDGLLGNSFVYNRFQQ